MVQDRRFFLKALAASVSTFSAAGLHAKTITEMMLENESRVAERSPESIAEDEAYWYPIQQAYTASPNLINLNNGGVSPQPLVVQDALDRYNRYANEAPVYTMWKHLDAGREPLREKLANLAGSSPEEIAIVRNATEALNVAIFGLTLRYEDEFVHAKQDYPNTLNALKMRQKRDGIKLVPVNLNLPSESESEITETYVKAFTPKTRAVLITQMINWNGQIIPTQKICEEARNRGIATIIDGAHTFAQIDYKVPELGGDYFGTSLHKWLSAPFGSGMLWVKKDRIKDLWPMYPNHLMESDDIRKFEGLGTRSIPIEQAIGHAIDFHNGIGTPRKEARLHYLKNYWAKKAAKIPGVKIHTSLKPKYACALALFSIDGMKPQEIEKVLFDKYKIIVVSIEWENINGIRVTPNIYTKISDLDKFVRAIEEIAKSASDPKKEG